MMRRLIRVLCAGGATLLLASCSGVQSALDPGGVGASDINHLTIVMVTGAAVVTLLVVIAIAGAFWARTISPSRNFWLFGGGVALPVAVLTPLILYSSATGQSMRQPTPPASERITVTAHQYWWDVTYERAQHRQTIISANEIVLPQGRPTEILLKATDVIHSFWVPALAGKLDMIPGRTTRIVLEPTKTGLFRGQCAEFCGTQHAAMAFFVKVLPPEDYERWVIAQAAPAIAPEAPFLRRGLEVFTAQGCGACHRIDGVAGADGRLGPDLTRVGSRQSIAAGLLPGGVGNLAAWIASAQHLKPGNKMPSYDRLTGEDLRAVSAYLESLK
jgi:cytochrome c oxidase subunit 2